MSPVACVIAVSAGGIGEAKENGKLAVRLYMGGYEVLMRGAQRLHFIMLGVVDKSAAHLARPKIEGLVNTVKFCRRGKVKSDISQMQPMRILA